MKSENEDDYNQFLDYYERIKDDINDITSIIICNSYIEGNNSVVNEIGNFCNDNDINFFNV